MQIYQQVDTISPGMQVYYEGLPFVVTRVVEGDGVQGQHALLNPLGHSHTLNGRAEGLVSSALLLQDIKERNENEKE